MPKIAFSPQKLKHIPTPPRSTAGSVAQVDYWDESQPGFGLRVSSYLGHQPGRIVQTFRRLLWLENANHAKRTMVATLTTDQISRVR